MNVLSLFDGMSCGQIALERSGIKVSNYFSSEIDKHAIQVTQDNYPNTVQLGSVVELDTKSLPKIDLLIGGSPCQNFSFIGKKEGMVTKDNIEITTLEQYLELKDKNYEFLGESYLFWEYVRVLKQLNPKYFLLENVRMNKKWKNLISSVIGVEPININSSLLSAQSRNRSYWTNIPNVEQPKDLKLTIKDILDNEAKFTNEYPKWIDMKFGDRVRKSFISNTNQKAECLIKSMYKGQTRSYCSNEKGELHKYSRNELERLQTVPINYTKSSSFTQACKMLGNGWTVDIIAHIFKNLK